MSFSSIAPLARATLASSSRVGLDFTLPLGVRFASTAPTPRAAPVRWQPIPQDPYMRKSGTADRPPTHVLSVHGSRNNTILTLADGVGPLVPSISGGTGKVFRKANRATYEAAHQAALKMFTKIADTSRSLAAQGHPFHLLVTFKGLQGHGREAVTAALSGAEGEEIRPLIVRVEDRTPLKIGGTRAPKPRRL